ncbi:MAG: T9SS type A sorting domain-containing protein [Bacteroidetes bacterium]|nr:T9SS type A sorting domain-containing protein [Bacteroidota bacterium]
MKRLVLLLICIQPVFTQAQTTVFKKIAQRHDTYTTGVWNGVDSFRWDYNAQAALTQLHALKGNTTAGWNNLYRYTYILNANDKISMQVRENYIGSAWVNNNRYTYTYDANGNTTEVLYETWNGSAWSPVGKIVYSGYNTQNKYSLMLTYTWNGSAWMNSTKDQYQYYSNGYHTQYIEKYSWDISNVTWDSMERFYLTYNMDSVSSLTRSVPGSSGWILDSRKMYNYTTSPFLLTEYKTEIWDTTQSPAAWKGSQRINYTYTIADKLEKATTDFFIGGAWVPDSRSNYTYDVSQKLIEYYDEIYSSGWQNNSSELYTYTGSNRTKEMKYIWSGAWVHNQTIDYDFDANDNTIYRLISSISGATATSVNRDYYYYQSFTVGLNDVLHNESSIKLYPIPVANQLQMDIESESSTMMEASVQDMNGHTILYVTQSLAIGKNHLQIDVQALPNGIYFLVSKHNGQQEVEKFQIIK